MNRSDRDPERDREEQPLPSDLPGIEAPVKARIEALFAVDQGVREALTGELAGRSAASRVVERRAAKAFGGFTASRFSHEERSRETYLGPNDDLGEVHEKLAFESAEVARHSPVEKSISIRAGSKVDGMIEHFDNPGDPRMGAVALGGLVDYLTTKQPAAPRPNITTAVNACRAEIEAERRAAAIEGSAPAPPAVDATTNGAGDVTAVTADADGAADVDGDPAELLVRESVELQMDTVTTPESQVRFAVPTRSAQGDVQKGVDTFELRAGASDVTSYHDFSTLQIAFPSVWAEVFDGRLQSLGEELYQEYVKLKKFTGVDDGADPQINTIDDLRRLIDEVKSLSTRAADDLPLPEGAGASGDVHVSSGSVVDAVKDVVEDVVEEVDEATRGFTAAIDNLLNGKREITWGSFPGPLPGPYHDVITTTFVANAAAPGTVEIVLADVNQGRSPWKGIAFLEFNAGGQRIATEKITNDWLDTDVWNATSYNKLSLRTSRIKNGVLEFDEEGLFGFHYGYYILGDLVARLADRTRVTFTW